MLGEITSLHSSCAGQFSGRERYARWCNYPSSHQRRFTKTTADLTSIMRHFNNQTFICALDKWRHLHDYTAHKEQGGGRWESVHFISLIYMYVSVQVYGRKRRIYSMSLCRFLSDKFRIKKRGHTTVPYGCMWVYINISHCVYIYTYELNYKQISLSRNAFLRESK